MSESRVSIAMTTFNGSAYLDEQLESFSRQTRPPDQLVVCDDGSGDDSVRVLEDYANRAPFEVRIERNPVRLLTTPNFGKAVSLCDGEVVFLADQDDVWLPDKVARVLSEFDAHPDAGAVFSDARVVDAGLQPLHYNLWDSLWFDAAERRKVQRGRALEVFVRHVVAAGTTLAFRGRFRALLLPFPSLRDCHDAWISFLVASVSGVRIVEEPLILYRLHGANQFGLKKLGLREQLEKARDQLSRAAFAHNVEFFSSVRARLEERGDSGFCALPHTFALIDAKIAHASRRNAMSELLWRRLPAITREILSGAYWRFSYGVKSIAQDILLR